ncbi:MAG: hypothetical protein JW909_02275 [Planctomycetes bacterium]|nr:hypothetical protein [Planctomycetota bacterium]
MSSVIPIRSMNALVAASAPLRVPRSGRHASQASRVQGDPPFEASPLAEAAARFHVADPVPGDTSKRSVLEENLRAASAPAPSELANAYGGAAASGEIPPFLNLLGSRLLVG